MSLDVFPKTPLPFFSQDDPKFDPFMFVGVMDGDFVDIRDACLVGESDFKIVRVLVMVGCVVRDTEGELDGTSCTCTTFGLNVGDSVKDKGRLVLVDTCLLLCPVNLLGGGDGAFDLRVFVSITNLSVGCIVSS